MPKLKTEQSTKNRHNQVTKVKKGLDNVEQRTQPGNETQNRLDNAEQPTQHGNIIQNRPDNNQWRKPGKKYL